MIVTYPLRSRRDGTVSVDEAVPGRAEAGACSRYWGTGTLLAHLSPAQSETIGLIGTITVDIDHELAQLDPAGHRALRKPSVATPVP